MGKRGKRRQAGGGQRTYATANEPLLQRSLFVITISNGSKQKMKTNAEHDILTFQTGVNTHKSHFLSSVVKSKN